MVGGRERTLGVGMTLSAIAAVVACGGSPPPQTQPTTAPVTAQPAPPGPALATLSASKQQITSGLNPAFCLDDAGAGTKDGNPVWIWRCGHGARSQTWSFGAAPNGGNVLTGPGGKCLDLRSDPADKRGATDLAACSSAPSQIFKHYVDSTIRDSVSNKCLTASDAKSSARITLENCTAGNNAQVWNMADMPPITEQERVVVEDARIRLGEEILFVTGSSDIDPQSDEFVSFIAKVLKDHPGLDFIEVGGHADVRGSDADNVQLTQKRAEEVVKHLIADGVDPHRLRGVGYSSYCPLDPGDSEEAYAKNRRVEFQILRRDGKDLKTKWDGCDGAQTHKMKPVPIPVDAPRTKPK